MGVGREAGREPRPAACGATAMTQALAHTASPTAAPCTRRYHNQDHLNEYGHGGLPTGVAPGRACRWLPACGVACGGI
jgi:hypothetical protein